MQTTRFLPSFEHEQPLNVGALAGVASSMVISTAGVEVRNDVDGRKERNLTLEGLRGLFIASAIIGYDIATSASLRHIPRRPYCLCSFPAEKSVHTQRDSGSRRIHL